jgi:glutamate mutase epsilon subunit
MISTIISAIAFIVSVGAAFSARRSADAAERQATAAESQVATAKAQTQTAQEQAEAAKQQVQLMKQQMEQQSAPYLMVGPSTSNGAIRRGVIQIFNSGKGIAHKVNLVYKDGGAGDQISLRSPDILVSCSTASD